MYVALVILNTCKQKVPVNAKKKLEKNCSFYKYFTFASTTLPVVVVTDTAV